MVFSQNFEHIHVLHEQLIVLTIVTKEVPFIDMEHRIKIRKFGKQREFYRVKLYYGFYENPDVRKNLALCGQAGLKLNFEQTSFSIGSERITFKKHNPLPQWRRILFRNASSPIDFFKIPVECVVELGARIAL